MKYVWNYSKSIEDSIKKAAKMALFLDFDGTLSPLKPIPQQSKLPKQTKSILKKLASMKNLHLAIVSGRALSDVKARVGIEGIIYSGNHGMEWEYKGRCFTPDIPLETIKVLKTIKHEMEEVSQNYKGSLVENKTYSVAFHYRRVIRGKKLELENVLHNRFSKYLQKHRVSLIMDKDAYDIKANTGWTKGEVVNGFKKLSLYDMGKIIYIGDSKTDEDSFVKLASGITIKVGSPKGSHAKYFLRDEQDVQKFLRWLFRTLMKPSYAEMNN